MTLFHAALQVPSFNYPGVDDADMFESVAALATTAEASGFDALFVMDHLYQISIVGPEEQPMLESYTLLSALAARTSSLQLGTLVTGVTYRNPALLAKIVTTLDVVSSGRAILGIGAAWNDVEHRGYGFAFPPLGERMDRLEEALQICRAMFTEERPSFEGRHYQIHEVLNRPRPIRGDIPILVGGMGERRTLRLVAAHADACNLFGGPEVLRAKLAVLDRHCEQIGRDPDDITKTALVSLIIGEDESEVRATLEKLTTRRGVSIEELEVMAVYGTVDQVAEQLRARYDAGLDGIAVTVANPSPATVELAGRAFALTR